MAVELSWKCGVGGGYHTAYNPDDPFETRPAGTLATCSYCHKTITWRRGPDPYALSPDLLWDWHHFGKLTITEWP